MDKTEIDRLFSSQPLSEVVLALKSELAKNQLNVAVAEALDGISRRAEASSLSYIEDNNWEAFDAVAKFAVHFQLNTPILFKNAAVRSFLTRNFETALKICDHLFTLEPRFSGDTQLLQIKAVCLSHADNLAVAIEIFRSQILIAKPFDLLAHHNFLQMLLDASEYEAALDHLSSVKELEKSKDVETIGLRLQALFGCKQYGQVISEFKRQKIQDVASNPRLVSAVGNSLRQLGLFSEAIELIKYHAMAHMQSLSDPIRLLQVNLLNDLGKHSEALGLVDKFISQSPNYPEARLIRAQTLIRTGRTREGWAEFDARWHVRKPVSPYLHQVIPYLKPVGPKFRVVDTLLIWGEQGIGDHIMYLGYLERFIKLAVPKRVVVELDERLVRLAKDSFLGIEFTSDASQMYGEIDYQLPLGDLPKLLSLDSARLVSERFSAFLKTSGLKISHPNRVVGISWSTSANFNSVGRSVGLGQLLEFVAKDQGEAGLTVYILNYVGLSFEERQLIESSSLDLVVPDIDLFNDIDGVSEILTRCDHVYTIDNYLVHLVGALGVPATVFLPVNPDFRWGPAKSPVSMYESVAISSVRALAG